MKELVNKQLLNDRMNNYQAVLEQTDPNYPLPIEDKLLHIDLEAFILPTPIINRYDNENNHVTLNDYEFYLTNQYNEDDIGLIYAEVNYPKAINPHAFILDDVTLSEKKWVIDCGISEGFFAFKAARESEAKIIGIDPVAAFESGLNLTFDTFYQKTDFNFITAALGEHSEKETLLSVNQKRLCCSYTDTHEGNKNVGTISVPTKTLDEIAIENGLSNMIGSGLIKIDIEGAEMTALRGAINILKTCKPSLRIAVYHDYENAMLCRDIILEANPSYSITFRAMNLSYPKPRPYILFAD